MEELIVKESEKYIRDLFEKEIRENLRYHDIIHTEYVAGMADRIGKNSGLIKEDLQIVIVAAWFHDSGFVSRSDGHEEESQNIARKFLSSKEMSEEFIDKVLICIQATKMPQNPGNNLLAQVVCDADMAYLSEDFYMGRTTLLRKEWNHESKTKLSKKTYYQETVELFKNHSYYTPYAKKEYTPGKAKNFKLLHKLRKKKSNKGTMKAKQLQSDNKKLEKKIRKREIARQGGRIHVSSHCEKPD